LILLKSEGVLFVRKIKSFAAVLTTASLLVLTACQNDEASKKLELDEEQLKNLNEKGMPVVDEKIKMEFFADKSPHTADNWNDLLIWNTYEEMTNIDIEWEQVPTSGLVEKRNLALASGDLPDAFHSADMPPLDLLKYGQQGTFLPLNDLIDKYAPNLKNVFEKYPEVKKGLTFPDGNIYSLSTIYSPEFPSVRYGSRPWVNQVWLDKLGMEMPDTTEEYYQYLKAVKEKDPNGNGKADEIPYGGTNMAHLIGWLKGSFGIGNKGTNHRYVDVDPETNKLRFYTNSERYKEMLEYVNKLYSDGLIQQNIYTIEGNQFLANASNGVYGSTVFYSPEDLFGEKGKAFVGGLALKGPHGDQEYVNITPTLANIGGFVITSANKNPAATVRWMDHFYSDEGAKLFFMGVEGKTFNEKDGKYEYVEDITDNKEGLTQDQAIAKYLSFPGGGYPGIIKQEYFLGSETSPSSLEATDKMEPYFIEEVWPSFTYTVEENQRLVALSSDIEKYVSEMQAKFITGETPFSEWDNYVKAIEDMGLEDYMEIYQSAYERYKGE
jgi:putative aldouronate transport system substrate-binding protein